MLSKRDFSDKDERIFNSVPLDRFGSTSEVAKTAKMPEGTVRRYLENMYDAERVIADQITTPAGHSVLGYRRLREGEVAPLFAQSTHDGAPLALCWGGYTYKGDISHAVSQ